MALPPPLPDPAHIETRLLVVAEMLERAVAEVRRTMAEVKGDIVHQPPVAAVPVVIAESPPAARRGRPGPTDNTGSADVDC